MTTRAKVAVLRTQPGTVLHDYQRLFELAGGAEALDPNVTTILKDNISWHFPMPSANTTPWQLEGTILALRQAGLTDLVCVQNQTVKEEEDEKQVALHCAGDHDANAPGRRRASISSTE